MPYVTKGKSTVKDVYRNSSPACTSQLWLLPVNRLRLYVS